MNDAVFYLIAVLILISALATVRARSLLHAAIAFIGTLLSTACLFLLLGNEFVGLMQILVYAGGVVIFAVYTILLTNRASDTEVKPHPGLAATALLLSLATAGIFVWCGANAFTGLGQVSPAPEQSLLALGKRLLAADGGFLISFELISLLLLAALVGATAVARRGEDDEGDEA